MPTIALITIGQTPRSDIVPQMEAILAGAAEVVEVGALDGMTAAQIARYAPGVGDDVVVSRLRDGSEVALSKSAITERLQECIDALDETIDASVVLCTGQYLRFRAHKPVLDPDRIVFGIASALHDGGAIGVVIPTEKQRQSTIAQWSAIASHVEVVEVSPYSNAAGLAAAAEAMKRAAVELVVMSCFGFTSEMKRVVHDVVGVPVLLPGALVMRTVIEAL